MPLAFGNSFTVAGISGQVLSLDARTGKVFWRANVQEPLSAGVGGDGRLSAVVTRSNSLVVLEAGKEKWRVRLPSQTLRRRWWRGPCFCIDCRADGVGF